MREALRNVIWLVLVSLLALILAGRIWGQSGSAALQSLINAERAFSELAEEKGVKEAFLTYLADDSIVFRPNPVPGRKVYEVVPEDSSVVLTWEPAYAEAAVDGDLGYTTGPYELRDKNMPGKPPRNGHYVSIWQKQPGGLWKVVLDAGISHPQPGLRPREVMTPKEAGRPKRLLKVDKFAELDKLLKVEAEFSAMAASAGLMAAYRAFAESDIRFYRDGSLPETGIDSVPEATSKNPKRFSWAPMDGDVSRWGTMGFIFGTRETRGPDLTDEPGTVCSYLRIWRKNSAGKWKIALDLAVPVPPESSEQ